MDKETLEYYERNALSFAEGTREVDFSATQERFLSYLPVGGRILDFGCGAGRDTRYFLERGYLVDAIDGSGELCRMATAYTGIPVRQMYFQELEEMETYDGIWACSSILHLEKPQLWQVMERMERALKWGGVIYTSFKYGRLEGKRGGRYFPDYTEESFQEDLYHFSDLSLVTYWVSGDVRPGRGDEKWLNLILKREQE